MPGQRLAHRFGLTVRNHAQGRAFVGPDLIIGLGRLLWARAQDDPVQDRLPRHRVDFNHPPITQELGEIAADSPWLSGASGVPRLISSTPIFGSGIARVVGRFGHAAAIGSNGKLRNRLPLPA